MKKSGRIISDLSKNPLKKLYDEKTAGGEQIIDLTLSNPTLAGFEYKATEINSFLTSHESIYYLPASKGILSARKVISDYYKKKNISVNPDNIILTACTSEAYSFLFKLLCDKNDEILIPQPGYPLIEHLCELELGKSVYYRLKYENKKWLIDLSDLQSKISKKTKSIVIINPNNPVGAYIKKYELEKLNQICRKNNLALISDEVFSDFYYRKSPESVYSLADNSDVLTFVLSGISKVSALPQMKLGWIVISGENSEHKEAVEYLDFISDTYLSVSSPVQYGLNKIFSFRNNVTERINIRLNSNYKFLKSSTDSYDFVKLLYREGGWYSVVKINKLISDDDISIRLLNEENIFIYPGYFYGFIDDGYIVLSLLLPESDFRYGIKKIFNFFEIFK